MEYITIDFRYFLIKNYRYFQSISKYAKPKGERKNYDKTLIEC